MLDIQPLAGALGAEIHGLDLANPLGEEDFLRVRKLLNEYQVIFFREQDISPQNMQALARSFGPLAADPTGETVVGFPEISILESTPDAPAGVQAWQTDMTATAHPPMATMLKSVIIPPQGGDTLWSSMTVAYDALSFHMQQFLDGLTAVHDFSRASGTSRTELTASEQTADTLAAPVRHPVIRTHPETGRKSIYVNSRFTTRIDGLRSAESDAILDFLFEHVKTEEFTCRFRWSNPCLAIWDNRCTQHRTLNDYPPAHRRMERIIIDGDKPF